jgi:hypothetical protein
VSLNNTPVQEPELVSKPGTPEWFSVPNTDRKYALRVPSHADRIRYRRALAVEGIEFHSPISLCNALLMAAMRIMAESPEEAKLGVRARIERQRGAIVAYAEALGEEGGGAAEAVASARKELQEASDGVDTLAREIRDHDPRYAAMAADASVYWESAGLEAARMFLCGWEGIGEEFPEPKGQGEKIIPEAALEAIPAEDLALIGIRFDAMMALSRARRKNSVTPLSSSGAAATSIN